MPTGVGSTKNLVSFSNLMFLLDFNIIRFHKWPFLPPGNKCKEYSKILKYIKIMILKMANDSKIWCFVHYFYKCGNDYTERKIWSCILPLRKETDFMKGSWTNKFLFVQIMYYKSLSFGCQEKQWLQNIYDLWSKINYVFAN